MTIPTNPAEIFSPFIPTTFNIPEDPDTFNNFLQDQFARHADVINDKKIGVYVEETPTLNGNKHWYANTKVTRNGYQSFVFINGLPNGTLPFPANTLVINAATTPAYPINDVQPEFLMWHLWGTASKPPSTTGAGNADFFSFSNQGDSRISFVVSDTTITITTTVDLSLYYCFIVFEFIRAGTNGI